MTIGGKHSEKWSNAHLLIVSDRLDLSNHNFSVLINLQKGDTMLRYYVFYKRCKLHQIFWFSSFTLTFS